MCGSLITQRCLDRSEKLFFYLGQSTFPLIPYEFDEDLFQDFRDTGDPTSVLAGLFRLNYLLHSQLKNNQCVMIQII